MLGENGLAGRAEIGNYDPDGLFAEMRHDRRATYGVRDQRPAEREDVRVVLRQGAIEVYRLPDGYPDIDRLAAENGMGC